MAECLASLTTDRDPDYIEIDGKKYYLAQIDQLSILEQSRLTSRADRMGRLIERASAEDFSDAESEELTRVVDDLFELSVPKCPKAVAKRLGIWKKTRVIHVFFGRELESSGALEQIPTDSEASPAHGSKQSGGSSDSTGAAQATG